MKQGFYAVLLAAGLAGCGATPVEHRNYHDSDPSAGLFRDTLTWEWRRKDSVNPPAQMTAAEQEEFKKWKDSAGATERSEFEDWRAWQEWKRNNPK
jgi:hypothetical protein